MQKEQLIFKNMQKYKQTSLKQNNIFLQNQQRPTQNKRSPMQNQHLSFFSKILQNVHRSLRRFICEIIYYNVGPIQQSK